jgi:hypothetical protein
MLDYVQAALAALIVVLTAIPPLRRNKTLTWWGWGLIASAAASCAFALWGAYRSHVETLDGPYRFTPAAIQLGLEAECEVPIVDDPLILTTVPSALYVRGANLGAKNIDFEFFREGEVWRPSKTRITPPVRLFYSTRSVRPSEVNGDRLIYRYVWELNGKTLTFQIPLSKFHALPHGTDWRIRATLYMAGRTLGTYPDDQGKVVFNLSDFAETQLKNLGAGEQGR